MANHLCEKDGLNRSGYENRGDKGKRLEVVESDPFVLLAWLLGEKAAQLFPEAPKGEDFMWKDLWKWEPLVVLTEVEMLDTGKIEQALGKGKEGEWEKWEKVLVGRIKDWKKRLNESCASRLLLALDAIGSKKQDKKARVYALLEGVRKLQENAAVYREEIESAGEMDPALALLLVSVRNFGRIAASFNLRWEELAEFYVDRILHIRPEKAVPDRLWLSMERNPGPGDVIVKKDTAFLTDAGARYRSKEECIVEEIKPYRMVSLLLERDPEWRPAADLGFITAIWKKEVFWQGEEEGESLFGGKGASFVSAGFMIESPMFLLSGGEREVTLEFRLTEQSLAYLGELEEVCGRDSLVEDAFCFQITAEEGWLEIKNGIICFKEKRDLEVRFRLKEDFPPVIPAAAETHGLKTSMPVLRILFNKEARIFPYSWARQVAFEKMKIRTKVSESNQVKIYNELGELETAAPFAPFGVQPECGSWFLFGSYEMALKPVIKAGLSWQWSGLPLEPGGLETYYAAYGEGVKEEDFRIQTEWLADGKWMKDAEKPLFGKERGECEIVCCPRKRMPVIYTEEQDYRPGQVRGGFIRMVLVSPAMGFGHKLFRRLFARVMLYNSRHKRQQPVPAEPLSPQADAVSFGYEAEAEIAFAAGQEHGLTRLYHLSLLDQEHLLPVAPDKPMSFAVGPDSPYHIYLEFEKAAGCSRLRFFVDFAPLQKECEEGRIGVDQEEREVWSVWHDGGWEILPVSSILREDTEGFRRSGLIEIKLPEMITERDLDLEGKLVVRLEIREKVDVFPRLRGIYTNVTEVVGEKEEEIRRAEWSLAGNTPGITKVIQASLGSGGKAAENPEKMLYRMADRISARNRLVTAEDYEKMVLWLFPQVEKVKCLPGTDAKGILKKGVVTIVMMQKRQNGEWPLCTNELLREAEEQLKVFTSPFVRIDAVNPEYEEMTVRCRIVLLSGCVSGVVIQRLQQKLNHCISPWMEGEGMPEFGYSFSMQALRNLILEDQDVESVKGLTVLHVTTAGERTYELKEYASGGGEEIRVKASKPWCIAVPASRHLIAVDGKWVERAGVGELEIGKTFIIGREEEEVHS